MTTSSYLVTSRTTTTTTTAITTTTTTTTTTLLIRIKIQSLTKRKLYCILLVRKVSQSTAGESPWLPDLRA